ncbi:hypothetical protein F7Q92_19855, partial [Ideonella dechloratans]
MVFLLALCSSVGAQAQDETAYTQQGQLIRANQAVTALGPDLMGDKVSLFNGSTEFVQTDISLPGNFSIPVELSRRYTVSNQRVASYAFGDWDLNIPHIHGIFSGATVTNKGWVVLGAGNVVTNSRCTYFGPPAPAVKRNTDIEWEIDNVWGGNFLYVPGVGDEKMLKRDAAYTATPADGNTYGVVTKSNWQFRCTTMASDGEGFIGLAPDGTTYNFDKLVSRDAPWLSSVVGSMTRYEVWLLPTQITDRFGNWVKFTYDTTNPWNLTKIYSSDGRAITLNYSGGSVTSATDGTRTWTYAYTSGSLTQVTLPDNTAWKFSMLEPGTRPSGISAGKCTTGANSTWQDGDGIPTANPVTSTITHPSGAVGSFTFQWVREGKNLPYNGTPQCPGSLVDDVRQSITYPVRALTQKSLTGPGLGTQNWAYTWDSTPGSWYCGSGCVGTKVNLVAGPTGTTRYTFGNKLMSNEGQLLSQEDGWDGSTALKKTVNSYRAMAAGPYVKVPGWSGNAAADDMQEIAFLPLERRVISQQGTNFTWQATSFDSTVTFPRVTSETKSSDLGYSKTEGTSYLDNTTKWVMSQVSAQTVGGTTVASTEYDPTTALPLKKYAFGK